MFNSDIFGTSGPQISIPENADVVFVSDLFIEDYVGGAELTTQALIDAAPVEIFKVHSKDVTMQILEQGSGKYWIFGNFASLDYNLIPTIVANLKYCVLEYDYKYCKYRSPEKHREAENSDCNCHDDITGKMVSAFYYGATTVWWMSEGQQERYHQLFPFLSEKNNVVLSSVFGDEFFANVKILSEKYKDVERKGWLVLGSTSWIKGADDAEQWCKDQSKDYEVVWNLPYSEVLDKLAKSEGFVYLPKGADTCPRMVIEAKLLGCQLHLNENVQHANELWFNTDDEIDTLSYLYAARERFWNGVKYDAAYNPTISGYVTTKDCIEQNYPYEASIKSMLGFCNEVVVVDGGSTDGTWERLQELSNENEGLVIHKEIRDWDHKRFAVFDGAQKAVARSLCTGQFCWQQDSDEVVHENDYDKIKGIIRNFPGEMDLIALPVVEYWGGEKKVRMDITPWKWRLSRNKPYITHGIPAQLRRYDENGELFSLPGTDGCDYIRNDNYEPIPFGNFYTPDVDAVRKQAFINTQALGSYQNWFNQVVNNIPGVYHYSWFDIKRKINTYKNYWSQHWQSLYNITQEDTAENNMFFNKTWSEVEDKEIDDLAIKLADELGGWIFHSKVDFSRPTPHLSLTVTHPQLILDWIG